MYIYTYIYTPQRLCTVECLGYARRCALSPHSVFRLTVNGLFIDSRRDIQFNARLRVTTVKGYSSLGEEEESRSERSLEQSVASGTASSNIDFLAFP